MFQAGKSKIDPLVLAGQIVRSVRAALPIGSSNITPAGDQIGADDQTVQHAHTMLKIMRNGPLIWKKNTTEDISRYELKDAAAPALAYLPDASWNGFLFSLFRINDAINASVYRAGNCGEMTSTGLSMLCNLENRGLLKDVPFSFELINSSDHMLIKITVNGVEVICDPWVNHVCLNEPNALNGLLDKLRTAGITGMTKNLLLQKQDPAYAVNSHERVVKWLSVYEATRELVHGAEHAKPLITSAVELKGFLNKEAIQGLCQRAVLQKNYLFLPELKKMLQNMTDVDQEHIQELVKVVDEVQQNVELVPRHGREQGALSQVNTRNRQEDYIEVPNDRMDLAIFYVLMKSKKYDLAKLVINDKNADLFLHDLNYLLGRIEKEFNEIVKYENGAIPYDYDRVKEKKRELEAMTVFALHMMGAADHANVSPVFSELNKAMDEFNRGDNKSSFFEIAATHMNQLHDPHHIDLMLCILVDMNIAKIFDKNKQAESKPMIAMRLGNEQLLMKLIMNDEFFAGFDGVSNRNEGHYYTSFAKIMTMFKVASEHDDKEACQKLMNAAILMLGVVDLNDLEKMKCMEPFARLLKNLIELRDVCAKCEENNQSLFEGIILNVADPKIKTEMLEMLINNGAINLEDKDEKNRTPLEIAVNASYKDAALLVLKHMSSEQLHQESPETLAQLIHFANEAKDVQAVLKIQVAQKNAPEQHAETASLHTPTRK